MGTACSGSKKKQSLRQTQQELNMDQPYKVIQSRSVPGQKEAVASKLSQEVQDLLLLNKKYNGMLDLIGNLDELRQDTRQRINSCIILKSNMQIEIQNTIKRIMREQAIVKKVEETDQYLIHHDERFAIGFIMQMRRLSEIILTELKDDEQFQTSYPILCTEFEKLAHQIQLVISNSQAIRDSPLAKQYKKSSIDSNNANRSTQKHESLQQ